MSEPANLARLERWMQAVVTHPHCAHEGLLTAEALRHVESGDAERMVRSAGALSAADRLGIYQGMHLPRMVDALAADYPALAKLAGEDEFAELVRAYVQIFPSRSTTLNRLGDRLPEFLEGWGPRRTRARRAALARVELAITEVFDAEETPPLAPDALASVPPEAWPRVRFTPVAALRLLELRTNALDVLDAMKTGVEAPPVRSAREHVLIHRRDYAVQRRMLPRAAFALLTALVEGLRLGEALESLPQRGGARGLDPALVTSWAREWIAEGLFGAVSL